MGAIKVTYAKQSSSTMCSRHVQRDTHIQAHTHTVKHSLTHTVTHTTTLSVEDELKFWLCLHRCCQTRFATPLSSCICQQKRQGQCHTHTHTHTQTRIHTYWHTLAHTQSAQMNLKSRAKAFKSVAFVQANPYEVH